MYKKIDITEIIQTDTDFVWVKKNTTINTIAKILSPEGIHAILIGSPNNLEGIITHIDIVKATLKSNYHSLKAGDIMSFPIITYDINSPISDLIYKFISTKFVIIPVTDEKNIIGVVSLNDLFKLNYYDYKD